MGVVEAPTGEAPVVRKVLMTDELLRVLGASRVDWGEPDADGFYTPTIYSPEDDGSTAPVDADA